MDGRRARTRRVRAGVLPGAGPGPAAVPFALAALGLLALVALVAPLSTLGAVARAATFLGTLAAIGVCVFAALAHDRAGTPAEELALRRAVLAGVLVGIVSSFVWLAVELADISGRGLAGLTDSTSLHIVMRNGAYASAVLRALGLAFIGYVAAARWRAPTAGPLVALGAVPACAGCLP